MNDCGRGGILRGLSLPGKRELCYIVTVNGISRGLDVGRGVVCTTARGGDGPCRGVFRFYSSIVSPRITFTVRRIRGTPDSMGHHPIGFECRGNRVSTCIRRPCSSGDVSFNVTRLRFRVKVSTGKIGNE